MNYLNRNEREGKWEKVTFLSFKYTPDRKGVAEEKGSSEDCGILERLLPAREVAHVHRPVSSTDSSAVFGSRTGQSTTLPSWCQRAPTVLSNLSVERSWWVNGSKHGLRISGQMLTIGGRLYFLKSWKLSMLLGWIK